MLSLKRTLSHGLASLGVARLGEAWLGLARKGGKTERPCPYIRFFSGLGLDASTVNRSGSRPVPVACRHGRHVNLPGRSFAARSGASPHGLVGVVSEIPTVAYPQHRRSLRR